jgi:hypothetical protein
VKPKEYKCVINSCYLFFIMGGQKVHYKVTNINIIVKNHADNNIEHIYDAQCFLCSQNGYYPQKEGGKNDNCPFENFNNI